MRRAYWKGLCIALVAGVVVGLSSCEKKGEETQESTPKQDRTKTKTDEENGKKKGEENGKGEDSTPELKLDKSHVEAIAGLACEITITGGSGQLAKPVVDDAEILDAEVKGDKLVLKVKKAGRAEVSLTDSKTKKSAKLTAQTYMLAFDWATIPEGTFMMGSPDGVGTRNEHPQHEVTLSSFRMATTEVTFDQYEKYCQASKLAVPDEGGYGKGTRPVINVSWEDAKAFCDWAGVQLPTEAQWEYAWRAGSKEAYGMGKDGAQITVGNLEQYGWYDGNAKNMSHPVKEKLPNAYGLYDMHGNVIEWCADRYDYYTADAQVNPTGANTGEDFVIRGGEWAAEAKYATSTNRSFLKPDAKNKSLGFRVAAPASMVK